MHHPLFVRYCTVGAFNPEIHFQEFKESLYEKDRVMNLSWSTIAECFPKILGASADDAACKAYLNGWFYDESTRILRHIFEEIVYNTKQPNLENYL